MGKKLAIRGHLTRGKEIIELFKMMGGCECGYCGGGTGLYYYISQFGNIEASCKPYEFDTYTVYTLEEFLEKYPFKVGDKVFLYDNITEGYVTGMKWDEINGTVKYCVYTSAEYWCDVKELLKWNPIDFLEDKHCNEKQVNGMKNVLTELLNHIKNTPKEELEREFNELEEWPHVGPTVEEFMAFCECVNKKPVYPKTYEECLDYLGPLFKQGHDEFICGYYSNTLKTFQNLLICRRAYWEIAGKEMGLGKPWEPKFGKYIHYSINFYLYQDSFVLHKGEYSSSDNRILVFPFEEMRDAFYENFKDLIEQCKELL